MRLHAPCTHELYRIGARRESLAWCGRSFAPLSVFRPKIANALRNHNWAIGETGGSNANVLKVETANKNLGEAGIESTCLRIMGKLFRGQPRTQRLWGQRVLSRRVDNSLDDGLLHRVGQKNFRQARGTGRNARYAEFSPSSPELPESYAFLRSHAFAPEAESDAFTLFLAATRLLGHDDKA